MDQPESNLGIGQLEQSLGIDLTGLPLSQRRAVLEALTERPERGIVLALVWMLILAGAVIAALIYF